MTDVLEEGRYYEILDKPVMRVGAVADLLGVCPRMVRIYEERGLVKPERKNSQRLYSFKDVCWLARIRELINEEGYDMAEIARLISLPGCWQLRDCPSEKREKCPAAQAPGKRCWEVPGACQHDTDCETCQIYRIAHSENE
jgi:MerR family transcriptional regulator/heat shock protein HspR